MVISTEDDKRSNSVTCITYHPNQKHIVSVRCWILLKMSLIFLVYSKVFCGSEEGTLTIWDLRQPAFPASYYTVHENSAVNDIAFHHTDPTKLLTASEAGELFQWSHKTNPANERLDGQIIATESENLNPWLSGQRTKSRINVSQPIETRNNLFTEFVYVSFVFQLVRHLEGIRKSINSFDTSGTRIICGCDNEAVYLIDN